MELRPRCELDRCSEGSWRSATWSGTESDDASFQLHINACLQPVICCLSSISRTSRRHVLITCVMSNLQALSDAQVILLAAQFVSDVNVESLQVLAAERKDVLTRDLIYRLLLTLLPTNETARSALLALLRTARTDFVSVSQLDSQIDISAVTKLAPQTACNLANQIFLDYGELNDGQDAEDPLATFVIAWSHHVESTDGALEDLVPLIGECMPESPSLQRWAEAYLLPLVRLRYHSYAGRADSISLQELETLSGISGVSALLGYGQRHSAQAQVARDLNELVAPWIEGSARASWADVYEWILDASLTDFPLAAKALLEWDGPPALHRESSAADHEGVAAFAQTALAVVYAGQPWSDDLMRLSRSILQRFAAITHLSMPEISPPDPEVFGVSTFKDDVSDANLLQNSLLSKDNKLTYPSESSVAFLAGVLKTGGILMQYKIHLTVAEITHLCLSALAEQHDQELRRLLQQIQKLTNMEPDWPSIRQQLLWLRSWHRTTEGEELASNPVAALGHLSKAHVESNLFDTMLSMGYYTSARQIYLESRTPPLKAVRVEDQVVAAIYSAFDNASNGNRTRGGVRRASDILAAFRTSFPHLRSFRAIEHLLKATHSLSFYQLTLQHGVPFRPVNIRALNDPLDLVARVLEQDSKAYTKLDDLLEIGRNLVRSKQNEESERDNSRVVEAEQRVTYLAITAALAAHDFDTAYSYITTRMSTASSENKASGDDFSWRAAYAAGRYRPAQSSKSLHDRIGSLSKRMDLLSLSLTLAPRPDFLSEILGQWRRCEEEMDTLKAQALQEEKVFDEGDDDAMPGGFGMQDQDRDAAETKQALAKRSLGGSTATYEEEAPMGLFDVARGAATALRKSAFPLNAASMKDLKIRDGHSRQASDGSGPTSPVMEDGSGRARKRDMVSNMVTSGLVSGMGWVLGAQPANKTTAEDY